MQQQIHVDCLGRPLCKGDLVVHQSDSFSGRTKGGMEFGRISKLEHDGRTVLVEGVNPKLGVVVLSNLIHRTMDSATLLRVPDDFLTNPLLNDR